ncbi:hypothetical protein [Pseudotabrizicola sp. L79]|uniref:hypothetical protein n=1 Tax=Pseudotabrizicola sp. L79 TaxID=3118402 RepID=UPI002F91D202
MICGVVIWYSRVDFKALIWCEDSGALAFATGPTSWRNPMVEIAVGDCVAFVAEEAGRERKCRDIHLIAAQMAPDLPLSIQQGRGNTPTPPPQLSLCSTGGVAQPAANKGNPLLHLCASRD